MRSERAIRCDRATRTVSLLADGVEVPDDATTRHIGRCLRCQAELAQLRRVRRSLASLRERTVEPAPGLLGEILTVLDDAAEAGARRSGRHVVAYVLAVSAAGAAGAAGAVVLATRRRRVA